jgi:pimeloyl-ACP methyl ester carboxylesterase
MSDFWGMQGILAKSGRRVCTFDKPGLGWSDYFYVNQNVNASTFYHQFMSGIGEKTPYIFVGWGGGAETIWPYANEHPEMVSAIVWMDAYSSGIEWRELQYSNNWTDAQAQAKRSLDITGRINLFHVIRGLGAPWGLNVVFVPYSPAGYEPADRYDEYRWFYLTDKTVRHNAFSIVVI